MKFIDGIKKIIRIHRNVAVDEIKEIQQLKITEEDKEQAKHLAILIAAGLASCGIPCGVLSQKIIADILAYALRDLKDGIEVHDKLIIGRIVNEYNKENKGQINL